MNRFLDIEDLPHASTVIYFPMVYNELQSLFYPHVTGTQYFADYHLERFKNTFTKIIYQGNDYFANTVTGALGPIDNWCDEATRICPPNHYKSSALSLAGLSMFDDYSSGEETVYNILMQYYSLNLVGTSNTVAVRNVLNSNKYKGFADLVAAQWRQECFSQTLKNRNVVYSQDFWAKDELLVDPSIQNEFFATSPITPQSFADPEIVTPDFIIQPGVEVNMRSGNRIILKKGFHAKRGSRFHAYIDPALNCANMRIASSTSGSGRTVIGKETVNEGYPNHDIENIVKSTKEEKLFPQPTVYPNPNNGEFTVSLPAPKQADIIVINLLGEQVFTISTSATNTKINLSQYGKGVYLVQVQQGEQVYRQKVIYN